MHGVQARARFWNKRNRRIADTKGGRAPVTQPSFTFWELQSSKFDDGFTFWNTKAQNPTTISRFGTLRCAALRLKLDLETSETAKSQMPRWGRAPCAQPGVQRPDPDVVRIRTLLPLLQPLSEFVTLRKSIIKKTAKNPDSIHLLCSSLLVVFLCGRCCSPLCSLLLAQAAKSLLGNRILMGF